MTNDSLNWSPVRSGEKVREAGNKGPLLQLLQTPHPAFGHLLSAAAGRRGSIEMGRAQLVLRKIGEPHFSP